MSIFRIKLKLLLLKDKIKEAFINFKNKYIVKNYNSKPVWQIFLVPLIDPQSL
jgi:hypothetical protein